MNPITWLFRVLIKGYQWFISPVLPGSCRYYPSCSSYALEALNMHGPLKGSWLGLKRIVRCHPWNDGGYDPVPGTHPGTHPDAHPHTHHHDHHHEAHGSCGHTEHSV